MDTPVYLTVQGDKIYFVGCDPQGANFEIEKGIVSSYLNEILGPDSASVISEKYSSLPHDLSDYTMHPDELIEKNREAVEYVFNYISENRDFLVMNSSQEEYDIALMASHLIRGREYIYRVQDFGVARDSLMAVYSSWWSDILDSKVAVWAHNRHVMDASSLGQYWMGTYLKQQLGEEYRTVGFSFGKGCLNAFLASANGSFAAAVRKQNVPKVKCRTINALLTKLEGESHYLIFDELHSSSYAGDYFNESHDFYQMGAGFNNKYISNYTQSLNLSKLYDVLIHFDDTNESELR